MVTLDMFTISKESIKIKYGLGSPKISASKKKKFVAKKKKKIPKKVRRII